MEFEAGVHFQFCINMSRVSLWKLPPSECLYQRKRSREGLYNTHNATLCNSYSIGIEIAREWKVMSKDWDLFDAERRKFEAEKTTFAEAHGKFEEEKKFLRWEVAVSQKKAETVEAELAHK
ncbi:hypothetical protein Hanom_Chr12g01152141 [Helianthus anomalus]